MTDQKRRDFIRIAGATAVIPASALVGTRFAAASDLPLVDAASPQAVALSYVAETTTEGQTCDNCALYVGEEGAETGTCPLFQGVSVGAKAWCSAWVVKG